MGSDSADTCGEGEPPLGPCNTRWSDPAAIPIPCSAARDNPVSKRKTEEPHLASELRAAHPETRAQPSPVSEAGGFHTYVHISKQPTRGMASRLGESPQTLPQGHPKCAPLPGPCLLLTSGLDFLLLSSFLGSWEADGQSLLASSFWGTACSLLGVSPAETLPYKRKAPKLFHLSLWPLTPAG